jgi:methylmalonyl-CoA/ethylmalonyl-CoA epimerase
MPNGPFAHVCFLVADLDKAVEDWIRILRVVDPGQLKEPLVKMEDFNAGEDVMRWATFVNPEGCEIQLLQPVSGPLRRRLEKHGEGVHHIAFCRPDLLEVVRKLDEAGVKLTSTELSADPVLPWQAWTFISPESSHGTLVELAWPYKPVDGRWEKGY